MEPPPPPVVVGAAAPNDEPRLVRLGSVDIVLQPSSFFVNFLREPGRRLPPPSVISDYVRREYLIKPGCETRLEIREGEYSPAVFAGASFRMNVLTLLPALVNDDQYYIPLHVRDTLTREVMGAVDDDSPEFFEDELTTSLSLLPAPLFKFAITWPALPQLRSSDVFVVDADTKFHVDEGFETRLPSYEVTTEERTDLRCNRAHHALGALWSTRLDHPDAPPLLDAKCLTASWSNMMLNGSQFYYEADLLRSFYTNVLEPHTLPSSIKLMRSTAALFYGPAGTGKTILSRNIIDHSGVLPIRYLSAPELNSRYYGDEEKATISLFNVGKRYPHALCCIVIDEIDTLTAKRTALRQEFKLDWLSLLLRLVGSRDHPNVLLIGCTNRRHAMDDAFLRPGRMDQQFFVGRLRSSQRATLLARLLQGEETPPQQCLSLSTDFTAALMEKFATQYAIALRRNRENGGAVADRADMLLQAITKTAISADDPDLTYALYHDLQLQTLISEHAVRLTSTGAKFCFLPRSYTGDIRAGRILADARARKLSIESSVGMIEHDVRLPNSNRDHEWNVAHVVFELARVIDCEHRLILSERKFKSWEERGVEEAFDELEALCKIYATQGGVLLLIDLDEVIGTLPTTTGVKSKSNSSSQEFTNTGVAVNSNRSNARDESNGQSIAPLRPYAFNRVVRLASTFKYFNRNASNCVLFCAVVRNPYLRQLFLTAVGWDSHIPVPMLLDQERMSQHLSSADGSLVRNITTTAGAVMLTSSELPLGLGRYYITVQLTDVASGTSICQIVVGVMALSSDLTASPDSINFTPPFNKLAWGLALETGTFHMPYSASVPFCSPLVGHSEVGMLIDMANHGTLAYYIDGVLQGVACYGLPAGIAPVFSISGKANAAIRVESCVDLPLIQPLSPPRPIEFVWASALFLVPELKIRHGTTLYLPSNIQLHGNHGRISITPPLVGSRVYSLNTQYVHYWEICNPVNSDRSVGLVIGVYATDLTHPDAIPDFQALGVTSSSRLVDLTTFPNAYAVFLPMNPPQHNVYNPAVSRLANKVTLPHPPNCNWLPLSSGLSLGVRVDCATRWMDVFRATPGGPKVYTGLSIRIPQDRAYFRPMIAFETKMFQQQAKPCSLLLEPVITPPAAPADAIVPVQPPAAVAGTPLQRPTA